VAVAGELPGAHPEEAHEALARVGDEHALGRGAGHRADPLALPREVDRALAGFEEPVLRLGVELAEEVEEALGVRLLDGANLHGDLVRRKGWGLARFEREAPRRRRDPEAPTAPRRGRDQPRL
jgi:hypothetical protein